MGLNSIMKEISDFNELVPFEYRRKLNEQKNRVIVEASYDKNGRIIGPYIFVVGLGEIHYKDFKARIEKMIHSFEWMKKRHIKFIMNELIINTQFSMLRQLVKRVGQGEKAAGFFHVIVYPCADFFSASIQEFGDYFDYYGYLEYMDSQKYDSTDEKVYDNISSVTDDKVKLILTADNDIEIADNSNKIALDVIEKATEQDFYVTSFYKEGSYKWKRIYFRVDNQ